MPRKPKQTADEKLDTVIGLLQNLLTLELARGGVSQDKIARHLHISKTTVVSMLHGVKWTVGNDK